MASKAQGGVRSCSFRTERLMVAGWHTPPTSDRQERNLTQVVMALLSEPVTRMLPKSWQGTYTPERASRWIEERDEKETNLLAVERATDEAIGLLVLHESPSKLERGGIEVRLGYVLAEHHWGRGLATELVGGFVEWCREQGSITSLAAGTSVDNPASMRVLEKTGFKLVRDPLSTSTGEVLFQLDMTQKSSGR